MSQTAIHISLTEQRLKLYEDAEEKISFAISTALNGAGECIGSGCTPRGEHKIKIKIGAGCAEGSVFVGRRSTGEIYSAQLAELYPERDWILTRILWITGVKSGFNRGGDVDTLRRMIYIHGTPDSELMGEAKSHGCIRMRNQDMVELFDQVVHSTPVFIEE
ncbi:MAG: L,D-transpeptidase [Thiotrichales bacterium]|jgi:hypothetical protein|nr:L,D-transpeptidase [Thiotrichales bacterium]MBT3614158.1 L,D-transpeptidase [Thiotrichales bacterium]MBT3752591.1 L,D-transpeptidase [Thiotrichales bacterium]MBT3838241.1 L,D-transpeptidase [Thiotrichales bacterium]MBT4152521.1 L,D-transpeptidase [Thiotrichales bacterium]